jgi:hypothetical protein
MTKKPKFKPQISRVKLNPEQAVLSCSCYSDQGGGFGTGAFAQGPGYRSDFVMAPGGAVCSGRSMVHGEPAPGGPGTGDRMAGEMGVALS